MNKAEILDKVETFYARPETKPGYDGEICRYYVDENSRCAIGCLLEPIVAEELDSVYKGSITNLLMNEQVNVPAYLKAIVKELYPDDVPETEGLLFLARLQREHDGLALGNVDASFGTRIKNHMLSY